MNIKANNVVIIGSGLAGTLMAILLARKGVSNIRILERQPEALIQGKGNGRSFNLTISKRGESALAEAGILDEVLKKTLPVTGRMCHMANKADRFFPYGDTSKHILHAIRRSDMNSMLLLAARRYPQIHIDYDVKVQSVNKNTGEIIAQYAATGDALELDQADFVIGADGAFSAVRASILAGERSTYSQTFLAWNYREVKIPLGQDGQPLLDVSSLHVWPRNDVMMFALPNPDGSFTGNLIYPIERDADFQTSGVISDYFLRHFPDLAPALSGIEDQLKVTPPSNFQTIRTDKWHHGDNVVLIGDAAHGIIPFYGQGMNSSFDDCIELIAALEKHGDDYESAFRAFKNERKKNTDLIADLSIANFEDLRNSFRNPLTQARRNVDSLLFRLLPNTWVPLHIMISHTCMTYTDALKICTRRERIARVLGLEVLVLAMLVKNTVQKGLGQLGKLVNMCVPAIRRVKASRV